MTPFMRSVECGIKEHSPLTKAFECTLYQDFLAIKCCHCHAHCSLPLLFTLFFLHSKMLIVLPSITELRFCTDVTLRLCDGALHCSSETVREFPVRFSRANSSTNRLWELGMMVSTWICTNFVVLASNSFATWQIVHFHQGIDVQIQHYAIIVHVCRV